MIPQGPRRKPKLVQRRSRGAGPEIPAEGEKAELFRLQPEYSCHGIELWSNFVYGGLIIRRRS
ncbi:MAG: hypothetical protein OXU63_11775, partial [Acidobacteriota bacterium]|nr:hypothetical protein [Acidobacteriota bacterium]